MKHIVMTEAIRKDLEEKMILKLREEFTNARNGVQKAVTISYTPEEIELENPIILNFSGMAYIKQLTLVQKCTSEIAWHGTVKHNPERTVFSVEDILVYPQAVTGATVVTDETKYEDFKNGLNNEDFNALRFQAHSHVHMNVTPSGVDRNMYDSILQCLGNQSFYIFMIVNKSNQMHIELFDLKNNAIYSNNDIVVLVEGVEIDSWYLDVYEKNITTRVYTAPINPPYNSALARAAVTNPQNTHSQPTYLESYRDFYEDEPYDPYATYENKTPAGSKTALAAARAAEQHTGKYGNKAATAKEKALAKALAKGRK